MSGWRKGRSEVVGLIDTRAVQHLPEAVRSAPAALARARRILASAAVLAPTDPDSAYVLAYDAARQAGTAVLAAQALRATATGGHVAVERVLRAQFAPGFADFHLLRRRRHELEYPDPRRPDDADPAEAEEAIAAAAAIVDQAEALLPRLAPFF